MHEKIDALRVSPSFASFASSSSFNAPRDAATEKKVDPKSISSARCVYVVDRTRASVRAKRKREKTRDGRGTHCLSSGIATPPMMTACESLNEGGIGIFNAIGQKSKAKRALLRVVVTCVS